MAQFVDPRTNEIILVREKRGESTARAMQRVQRRHGIGDPNVVALGRLQTPENMLPKIDRVSLDTQKHASEGSAPAAAAWMIEELQELIHAVSRGDDAYLGLELFDALKLIGFISRSWSGDFTTLARALPIKQSRTRYPMPRSDARRLIAILNLIAD
jgi:NTP pyrophosphatase (non-canonical NTP hydrolase)